MPSVSVRVRSWAPILNEGMTTMKVKCIGGPNDGEWHDIRNDTRINDHVPMYVKPKLTSVLDFPKNIDECMEAMATTIQINYYILKCLREIPDKEFKYLVPVGQNSFDCLVKQLEGKVIHNYDKINRLFEVKYGISFDEWVETHERIIENG